MSLLVARNLSVGARLSLGSFPVISDLSFSLQPGKVLGLVGESGAGKSMIGRTIAQLLPPGFAVSDGDLRFAGQDLVGMKPRQRRALLGREIAFIPQEPLSALNPVLTVGQQMAEHLARIGRVARSHWRQKAIDALGSVHLDRPEELLDKYPHQLSGGMCQRVLIAMAFASRPRLLVADEPTTALDVTIQARIVKLLSEMQQRDGTAVIFITHDLRLAAQLCDEIIVLYAGRPAEKGPARELFSRPAHPYTRTLQLANPNMTGPRRGLFVLPERMPGLSALKTMTGCRFASRCPAVVPECRNEEPPFAQVGSDRVSACIRPEATATIAAPSPSPAPGRPSQTPILRMENVSKTFVGNFSLFRRRPEFRAVRNAAFTVAQNEFVGLVGESGSGKSTLARIAAGLDRASEGRIFLNERDVTANRSPDQAFRRSRLQMIFQDPQSALNPRRRVASIVTQALEASGRGTPAERFERARELLAEIGLSPDAATRFPSQLSGGQKQRVNIARALGAKPQVLVADEIVSGLDVSVQAQLLDMLIRIRREHGLSMLFISHDLSVVRYLCDRVLVMYRGKIVENGAVEDVFASPQHSYTKLLLSAVPPDEADREWLPDEHLRAAVG